MLRRNSFYQIKSASQVDADDFKCMVDQGRICAIDSFDQQGFNINEAGWVRNDISQLARAQSLSEYEAILRKLATRPDQPDDGLTDDQRLQLIKPRYCQSYNEVVAFADKLTERSYAALHDAYDSVHVPNSEDVVETKSE